MNNTNSHQDGFSIPADYLNKLENKLRHRTIDIHDGYTVPESYFAQLINRILLRTVYSGNTFLKPSAFRVYSKYAVAAAVVAVSSLLLYMYQQPSNFSQALHTTDEAVLIEYIEVYGESEDVYYVPSEELMTDEEVPYLLFES